MKQLVNQLIKFGIVGVIATIIDWTIFYLLFNLFNVNYLVAKTIAFAISTVFNYLLSMKYVFQSKFGAEERHKEFQLFVLSSLIGLSLTLILLWFTVEIIGIHANYANIMVAVVVMCINFVLRKLLFE